MDPGGGGGVFFSISALEFKVEVQRGAGVRLGAVSVKNKSRGNSRKNEVALETPNTPPRAGSLLPWPTGRGVMDAQPKIEGFGCFKGVLHAPQNFEIFDLAAQLWRPIAHTIF